MSVNLSEPAISALDALAQTFGQDRSRALDALLLGHVNLPKRKKSAPSKPLIRLTYSAINRNM